jgi:hypothetical protein
VVKRKPIHSITPLKLDLINKKSLEWNYDICDPLFSIVIDEKGIVPEDKESSHHKQGFLPHFLEFTLFYYN